MPSPIYQMNLVEGGNGGKGSTATLTALGTFSTMTCHESFDDYCNGTRKRLGYCRSIWTARYEREIVAGHDLGLRADMSCTTWRERTQTNVVKITGMLGKRRLEIDVASSS